MPGIILAGNSGNPELFRRVAERLGEDDPEILTTFDCHKETTFADRELKFKWGKKVVGRHAIILAVTRRYRQWEGVYQMMSAARDAKADAITVIFVYYGSARQDRKDEARVAISLRMHAEMVEANGVPGRTYVCVLDPHNVAATQCAFRIPCDIVYARPLIVPYLKARQGEFTYMNHRMTLSPVVYPTDAGGTAMVHAYADRLRWHRGQGIKVRKHPDATEQHVNFGPCPGRTVIFLDDLIDTAGTMCGQAAYAKSKKRGAKRVVAVGAHAVLAGPAVERLGNSVIDEIVVTNSLPIDPKAIAYLEGKGKKVTVLDVTDILVQVIRSIRDGESISSLFV